MVNTPGELRKKADDIMAENDVTKRNALLYALIVEYSVRAELSVVDAEAPAKEEKPTPKKTRTRKKKEKVEEVPEENDDEPEDDQEDDEPEEKPARRRRRRRS